MTHPDIEVATMLSRFGHSPSKTPRYSVEKVSDRDGYAIKTVIYLAIRLQPTCVKNM